MTIDRAWSMPTRHTFTMKPIRELLTRYSVGHGWVDPFAGWHSPAEHTNDINIQAPTAAHTSALEFVGRFDAIHGLLLDPPYSPRQIAECYKAANRSVTTSDTLHAKLVGDVKNAAAERMRPGAIAITCGWNSNGFGRGRGFELVELLLVAHGAAHNDTIVTVERKVT